MAFDREALFIGSFNLDSRSAVINTEAGLYIESPELTTQLTAYMATASCPPTVTGFSSTPMAI